MAKKDERRGKETGKLEFFFWNSLYNGLYFTKKFHPWACYL